MKITGLTFVGTRTRAHQEMTAFVHDVLGLAPAERAGFEADLFELPDGSSFVIASEATSAGERTIGFSVEDLDAAARELRAAGVDMDEEVTVNMRFRYVHFRAPDGRLYELVERLAQPPTDA